MRLLAALILVPVLSLGSASAGAVNINCPLSVANRAVADALPPEWRLVPYAEPLAAARITSSGAVQTLVCDYGQVGVIQRPAPAGHVCTTLAAGFACTLTVVSDGPPHTAVLDPRPLIHRSGTFRVTAALPGAHLDLDEGRVTAILPSPADLAIEYQPSTGWVFLAFHEAWAHGRTVPQGKAGCELGLTATKGILTVPPVGGHVCLRTSDGRVAEFRVTGRAEARPQFVTISYVVWPL